MSVNKPVTIIGGGLAGLALAAGLRCRGVPVTVLEAGSYPRHRVCGEFLSGLCPETLQRLGIENCFHDAIQHREVGWFRMGKPIGGHTLPNPALAISRFLVDHRLCHHVRSIGGEVIERTRSKTTEKEGTVWAAGRVPRPGSWIGLKCHVADGLALASDLEMHLGQNGYVGLAGIEKGRVNVCGLFRLERSRSGKGVPLLLSYLRAGGHKDLADRIASARSEEASFCAVAGFALGWQQKEKGGQCVIGDARAMIPPFTGNGMSMALQSADISVNPVTMWSHGELSWGDCRRQIRDRLRSFFRTRMSVAGVVNPLLVGSHAQKCIASLLSRNLLPVRPLLQLIR